MSATIMMPSSFDDAIRSMCTEAVNQAVASLAAKHGFDLEDALRDLNLGEIKLVRKRGPSPKVTEKSVTKKQKKEKNESKPKKAKTGYLMYQAEVRSVTKEELSLLLNEDEKLKPQAVVTAIAAKWKALSEEERDDWKARAKAAATPDVSDDEAPSTGIKGPRPPPVETAHVGEAELEEEEIVLGDDLDEIEDDE